MRKQLIFIGLLCFSILPLLGHAAGSFGGLVVPNMGQVKNGDWLKRSEAETCLSPLFKGGEDVRYYMDAPWGRLYVTDHGLLLNIIEPEKQAEGPEKRGLAAKTGTVPGDVGRAVRTVPAFVGAADVPVPAFPQGKFEHPEPRIVRQTGILLDLPGACWREPIPEAPQVTKLNFFYGNDPKGWVTDVPTYGRLRFKGIFPGTDLILEPKSLEFWRAEGLIPVFLDALQAQASEKLASFDLTFAREQEMSTASRPDGQGKSQSVLWGTYLGGAALDSAMLTLVDGNGDIVVAGTTDSLDFPILNPYDSTFNGGNYDIFLAKLSADGRRLLWGTYIGGSGDDNFYCLAFDSEMDIIMAGSTTSKDAPVTPGAFETTFHLGEPDSGDIYAAKLSAAGNSLLWGTYIGGRNYDWILSCAMDKDDNVILTGRTTSPDIPTPGGFDTSPSNYGDIYIAQLSGDGSSLLWATYLGGIYHEEAYSIALDTFGNIIIIGETDSPDIPAPGGYDTTCSMMCIYIAKISLIENKVIWGTFVDGNDYEASFAYCMEVNGHGEVYVVGGTTSPAMPTPNGYSSVYGGRLDLYAAKLSADGRNLLWGTYLPGSEDDYAWACALDEAGNLLLAGGTLSADIPVPNGYDTHYRGRGKMYIAKLAGEGKDLLWGTYLGGSDFETAATMAVDPWGNVIVAGYTMSPDFPVPNGYDPVYKGVDAVVAKISDPVPAEPTLFVAAAAKTSGAYGSDWRTDGMLFNPGAATVCYNLHYSASGTTGVTDTECGSSCLRGNSSRTYEDVLETACGISGESAGGLTVNPTGKILLSTRTYNQTVQGTYGQHIEGAHKGQGLKAGEKGHLIGIKRTADYRTNLGFSEIAGQAADVSISIYASSGSLLLTSAFSLMPYAWLQIGLAELGVADLDMGRAEIEVIAGGAALSYASVVDNRTGDAVFIPAPYESAIPIIDHQIIPVVAHNQGAYGTHWQSDLCLFNASDSSRMLELTYYAANSTYQASLTINPQQVLEIKDSVAQLFPTAGDGAGSLQVTGASGVLIVSRTYNQTGSGTYGQAIPAGGPDRLLPPGRMGWLLQLQCNSEYRTNVGFSEYAGQDADLEVDLFGTDGTLLASGEFNVPANRNVQVNDIFSNLGVPCEGRAAYARIVNISGGTIYPYASVVDNRTGDAIFIPVKE